MDIDIDFPTQFNPMQTFQTARRASRVQDETLKAHPAGVYFQDIPIDPITTLAAIPFKEAERLGYLKIDFLHLSLLDHFQTKQEVKDTLKRPVDWSLFQQPDVVGQLFQLHKHVDLVIKLSPSTVQELADCIALIRPAKRNMVNAYLKAKRECKLPKFRPVLYSPPKNGQYYFKKSHAVSYALTTLLQLHTITKGNSLYG